MKKSINTILILTCLVLLNACQVSNNNLTKQNNGKIVLEYEKPEMGGSVVNGYDLLQWHEGKVLSKGYIALQSEVQPVEFRNIQINIIEQN
ncbi:MAG: DUF1080 domain-containing protein [Colwellia sp.]